MEKIKVIIPTHIHHCAQLITGFLMLREQGWDIELVNRADDRHFAYHGLPCLFAEYRGKTLFYDVWDGYQDPPDMLKAMEVCDFYFKRSFSPEKNREIFGDHAEKVYPLGFNYYVTHRKNPVDEPLWKAMLRPFQGKTPARYFVPEVFEGDGEGPRPSAAENPVSRPALGPGGLAGGRSRQRRAGGNQPHPD